MSEEETLEETKAKMLMTLRNYRMLEREEHKNFVRYLVRIPKEDTKIIMWCMLNRETVGVRYINQLVKEMETTAAAKGIIVSGGSYSYAAKAKSKRERIELIPKLRKRGSSTLQKAKFTMHRNPHLDYGETYFLVVMCEKKWAKVEHSPQRYAVVVALEHSAQINIYNTIRQRIAIRLRASRRT